MFSPNSASPDFDRPHLHLRSLPSARSGEEQARDDPPDRLRGLAFAHPLSRRPPLRPVLQKQRLAPVGRPASVGPDDRLWRLCIRLRRGRRLLGTRACASFKDPQAAQRDILIPRMLVTFALLSPELIFPL